MKILIKFRRKMCISESSQRLKSFHNTSEGGFCVIVGVPENCYQ